MDEQSTSSTEASKPEVWEPLPPLERRVLGVLIEKQKTSKSADAYPLSLNALTTGCNQKSNREPVLDLSEFEVEEPLTALQKKVLVTRVTGSRVERFRHECYEKWTRNGPQLAVLAELLLRGPQTKGELRARAARMDPIDTLEQLDEVLKPLFERKLVVWLTEPDRRGSTLSHGFHLPEELASLRGSQPVLSPVPSSSATTTPSPSPDRFTILERKLTTALEEIDQLKMSIAGLESQLSELRKQLGG